jgi:hypothetical protein
MVGKRSRVDNKMSEVCAAAAEYSQEEKKRHEEVVSVQMDVLEETKRYLEAVTEDKQRKVDICWLEGGKAECSCGYPRDAGKPCRHVFAALRFAGKEGTSFISKYFSTSTWQSTYKTDYSLIITDNLLVDSDLLQYKGTGRRQADKKFQIYCALWRFGNNGNGAKINDSVKDVGCSGQCSLQ